MFGEYDNELRAAFKLEDKGNPNGVILQELILEKIKARNLANAVPKMIDYSSFEKRPSYK